jgi:hypothetical protein
MICLHEMVTRWTWLLFRHGKQPWCAVPVGRHMLCALNVSGRDMRAFVCCIFLEHSLVIIQTQIGL